MSLISFLSFFAGAETWVAETTLKDPILTDLYRLSPDTLASLFSDSQVLATASSWEKLTIWPLTPFADSIKSRMANRPSTLGIEGVYLFDRPPALSDEETYLKIYRHLQNLSSLKGLLYWSVSKKGWETLILESYRVAEKGSRQVLADTPVSSLPSRMTLFSFQKDNKLGEGYYQFDYFYQPNQLTFLSQNLDSLNWGFIPLVSPGDFILILSIKVYPQKVLLHALSSAKTMEFFGLERSKDESFLNRMQSFAQWFSKGLLQ